MKLRPFVLTIAIAAALLGATATPASAHTGWYAPAAVNCYSDGRLSIMPRFSKIGAAEQRIAYRIYIHDALRGTGYWWRDWQMLHYAYNHQPVDFPRFYAAFPQSDYYVGVQYAWDVGHGWETTPFLWTKTYTIGGDFFGYDRTICIARPQIVTVA